MEIRSEFFHKLTHYEYWPAWAFYFPVLALYPYFALRGRSMFFFTVANPCIPYGGCFGESKHQILQLLSPEFLPATTFIHKKSDLLKIDRFPVVAKPDIGERGDHVAVIESQRELETYFSHLNRPFLVQEYLTSTFEAGVMIYRDPESRQLTISSVAVKEYLKVTGDGTSNLETLIQRIPRAQFQWPRLKEKFPSDLILKDREVLVLEPIGNHCRGTTFLNANDLITPELCSALERALAPVKEFYFGRFDLKADSAEDLRRGVTIKIMELNGAFSEPGHIYDPREKLWKSWRDLIAHWNALSLICAKNTKRGFKASGFFDFASTYFSYRKLHQ